MDIGLPGMDGLAVTRSLKSEPRTAAIPVVAVTAAVIGRRSEEAMEVCDAYLTKPVSKRDLIEVLVDFFQPGGEGKHGNVVPGASVDDRTESGSAPAGGVASPVLGAVAVAPALRDRIADLRLSDCSVDEIEAIAGEILVEGRRAGDHGLVDLAGQLTAAARQFDMESVSRVPQDAGLLITSH